MGTEVAVYNANPVELVRQATDVAGACKAIVVQTACSIQGRKYVKVEGWQAIAVAHGCILSTRDVEHVEGGIRAIGEVRRMSDGAVLATAEGFVGDTEKTWGNREEYAKRAMAQTRAMSRVARAAFAHVVVMMNAGLETTPAEEIPAEDAPASNGNGKHTYPDSTPTSPVEATKENPKAQVDLGTFEDFIKSGRLLKTGKNRTGDWKLYLIETEGNGELKTFSKTVYDKAGIAAKSREKVTIVSHPGNYGPEIGELYLEGEALPEKNLASVP